MDWRNQAFGLVALILAPAALLAVDVWEVPLESLRRRGSHQEVPAHDATSSTRVAPERPESVLTRMAPERTESVPIRVAPERPESALTRMAPERPESVSRQPASLAQLAESTSRARQGPDLGREVDTSVDWDAPCPTYVIGVDLGPPADDDVKFETPSLMRLPATVGTTEETYLQPVASLTRSKIGVRIGWWGIETEGDLTKVGEYQGLGTFPFLDLDMLTSDRKRTIDMVATGTDDEGTQLDFYYFAPKLSADVEFQRYLRRLDHDPLSNLSAVTSSDEIVGEDLDAGGDYAVRIHEWEAAVKGKLTEKVKFRVNFRALRKVGHRQARAVQHCAGFDSNATPAGQCHVLSQGQRIDWLTVKVEPVVEVKLGPAVCEYSRPMKSFGHSDQLVTRDYGEFHGDVLNGAHPYAMVPENFTQTDRIKLSANLAHETRFYGMLKIGNTHNKFRQTDRNFHGFDLRLTNRSLSGVTLTGFSRMQNQSNQLPPFLLEEEAEALARVTSIAPPYGLRQPIDYSRLTFGADASWRPARSSYPGQGLSFTVGGEHGALERDFSERQIQGSPSSIIDHERTVFTLFHCGAAMNWSSRFDTFVRYKMRRNDDPLYAANQNYGYTNTSLPEREDRVEIGGTWVPGENFLATATFGIENRTHRSDVADFTEDDYPITCTLWYAPTPKWSLSAGYGYYSNRIDQDITFPSDAPLVSVGDSRRWSYGGSGQVLSIGGSYACSTRLTLSSGVEYVWSHDAFDPLEPWPDLPYYSDVIVDRTRVTAGLDCLLYGDVSANFRYILEDYEDRSVGYNSGTAQMFLTSLSAVY